MRKVIKFFDRLEDHVRAILSHFPMLYAIIGGTAIVLFWRGIWVTADQIETYFSLWPGWLLLASILIMMATGLFVSFFIGDRIILSGLKKEKKLTEKTEEEVRQEETILINIYRRLEKMEKDIEEIKEKGKS